MLDVLKGVRNKTIVGGAKKGRWWEEAAWPSADLGRLMSTQIPPWSLATVGNVGATRKVFPDWFF